MTADPGSAEDVPYDPVPWPLYAAATAFLAAGAIDLTLYSDRAAGLIGGCGAVAGGLVFATAVGRGWWRLLRPGESPNYLVGSFSVSVSGVLARHLSDGEPFLVQFCVGLATSLWLFVAYRIGRWQWRRRRHAGARTSRADAGRL